MARTNLRIAAALVGLVAMAGALGCSANRREAVARPGSATSPKAQASSAEPKPFFAPRTPESEHRGEPGETEEEHENEPKSLGDKYTFQNPPPETFRPADSGESATGSGRIPLRLRIVPGCAELGSTIAIAAKTKPNVQVGLLSNIPAPDGKAQERAGRSDEDGLFEWLLYIPTNIGVGRYDVFAAAADDKGDDGGRSGAWFFLVASPGQCP